MAPSTIRNTSRVGDDLGKEFDIGLYDPEAKANLDRAMSLTGLPETFSLSIDKEAERRKREILKSMMLTGRVDPTIEEVFGAAAPFIATKAIIQRAVASQGAVDRSIIIQPALRFVYASPLYRTAVPQPTMSPVPTDNMTPGQEAMYTSIACTPLCGGQPVLDGFV
jgi:hypothetical protein